MVSTTDPNGIGTSGGGGSLGNNFSVIANQIGGNTGKAWYMQMRSTVAGRFMTTTFTFSKAVVGLSFTIYDIDRVNGGGTVWTDKVVITGVKSGGGAANATPSKPAGSTVDIVTGTTATAPTYTGTGNANIAPTSTNGNGIVTFTNPVTSVTITYSNPEAANIPSTPFQFMGIGNLTWTRLHLTLPQPPARPPAVSALISRAERTNPGWRTVDPGRGAIGWPRCRP